jgi:hypothetical protein
MLGVFLPMMIVVLVEAAALEWLTGTDSEPVEGIQKNVEHELDFIFLLVIIRIFFICNLFLLFLFLSF